MSPIPSRCTWVSRKQGWLWSAVVVILLAVAVCILTRARHEPKGADYWSVAVPGVLTGVGTLILAIVTVWVSLSERARDDRLRAEQRRELEQERRDADDRAESERRRVAQDRVHREARNVVARSEIWQLPTAPTVTVTEPKCVAVVLNGSSSPILEVEVASGVGSGTDKYGPLSLVKTLQESDSYITPIILAGAEMPFEVGWQFDQGGAEVPIDDLQFVRGVLSVVIRWTDPDGNRWKRHGFDPPTMQP